MGEDAGPGQGRNQNAAGEVADGEGDPGSARGEFELKTGQRPGQRRASGTPENAAQDGSSGLDRADSDRPDPRAAGENLASGRPPGDRGEERVLRGPDAEGWGSLPSYLGFLRLRGGTVDVPERYRRLYEAFLHNGSRQGQSKSADQHPRAGATGDGEVRERR